MPKKNVIVKIKSVFENSEIKVPAIFQDNCVKYKENDNTTAIFNYTNNTLKRDGKSLTINSKFIVGKESEWEIIEKETGKTLLMNVKTKKFKINDKNINIEYIIDDISFLYSLEVIE